MRMALYALLFATVTATVIVNARIMTISGLSNGYCSRSYVNGRWITLGKCESGRSLESVVTSLQKHVERESGESTISDSSTKSYSDSTETDSIGVTTSTSPEEPDVGISTVPPSASNTSDSIEATTFPTADGSSTVFHADAISTDSVQVTTWTTTAEPDIAPSKEIDSDAPTIDSVQDTTLTNASKSDIGPWTLSYTESNTARVMSVTTSATADQQIIDTTMTTTFSTVSNPPRDQSSIEQGCGIDSDAKPAVSILHVNIGGTATYDISKSQCGNQGKRLCSAIEVCNSGTPVYGVLDGDHWIAIQDRNNEWIQIGNASGQTCLVYGPKYGLPCWGERSDGSVKSWLGHVYCCSVAAQ